MSDLISREALIEEVKSIVDMQDVYLPIIFIDIARNMPTVEAEPQWIPCSERLPEEKQHVQVTYIGYHDGLPYCNEFAYLLDGKWLWCTDDSTVIVEIVAWKLNCKPYKGK